ncbi:MAG: ribosome maturation factor RimM [Acidobacteriaceae bacterium]
MTNEASWTLVARLIRPQGRRGEVLAEILTDFPERFATMKDAFLDRPAANAAARRPPAPIAIEQTWPHKGRIVLKFVGVDSISAAESLRGADLVIPAADRVLLDADAAYIGDLIGCQLIDLAQHGHPAVGTVHDVIQQEATTDLLVIRDPDGVEHWIPFAKAYLVRMDLPGRRIEMNLPAGLLEVNAPPNEGERREEEERREQQAALATRDDVQESSG